MKLVFGVLVLLAGLLQISHASSDFEKSFTFDRSEWPKTNFKRSNVQANEILSGGPPKDGIPAIDNPEFISIHSAESWLHDNEPVIAVSIDQQAKAYPLQILMFHEIVNDKFDNKYVSVTFCPLCNTSIVFDRKIEDFILNFGTTGRLRKSDLIMYDRQTESWWQQFSGEAIIGKFTGTSLKELPSQIIAFKSFKKHFPEGLVLSQDTGFSRPYGNNPYRGYDHINNSPFLLNEATDSRLPPMERVISIKMQNKQRIYPFSEIDSKALHQDSLGETGFVIFKTDEVFSVLDKSSIVKAKRIPAFTVFSNRIANQELNFTYRKNRIIDLQTQSEWSSMGMAVKGKLKGTQLNAVNHGIHFAFAWLAFNPETEIYRAK